MKLPLDWREVIERNMPEQPEITDEVRHNTILESKRFRGSVRLSTGDFFTNREYQELRDEVLSTPLP